MKIFETFKETYIHKNVNERYGRSRRSSRPLWDILDDIEDNLGFSAREKAEKKYDQGYFSEKDLEMVASGSLTLDGDERDTDHEDYERDMRATKNIGKFGRRNRS